MGPLPTTIHGEWRLSHLQSFVGAFNSMEEEKETYEPDAYTQRHV